MLTLNAHLAGLRDVFATPPDAEAWAKLHRLLTADAPADPISRQTALDYAREHAARWWTPAQAAAPDLAWTWERCLALGALAGPGDAFAPLRDLLAAWRREQPLAPSDGLTDDERDRVCASLGAGDALPALFGAWLREAGRLGPPDGSGESVLYYPALADLARPARRGGHGHEAALEAAQDACPALGWTLDGQRDPRAPVVFAYHPNQERLFALDRSASPPAVLWVASDDLDAPPTQTTLRDFLYFHTAWIAALGSPYGVERGVPSAALASAPLLGTLGALPNQPDLSLHAFAMLDTLAIALIPADGAQLEPAMLPDQAHASFGLRHDPKRWPRAPAPWWVSGEPPPNL